jgi:hypothetical protein
MSDAIRTAKQVAGLVERTLAPLLLAMTPWRPEFRVIVLDAVSRRAAALAAETRELPGWPPRDPSEE